ncbi:MAG: BON domain-containing protein [Actinomycetota bacterium]|nr:BON domain-containing protein [Actinomycetota bacterium]
MDVPEYAAQRLRQQLARDERVAELGIDVTIVEGKVFVRGKVSTAERREAIEAVAREVLPDLTIVNEVTITKLDEPQLENLR